MTPAPADLEPVRLHTARFLLRPPEPSDAEAIHRSVNDWGVVRMLARLPFPYPRPLADEWIASTGAQAATGHAYHFVIADKQDEQTPLGCVGLLIDTAANTGELGYWIARRRWGEGVATEAAARLASWAFEHGLDRLVAQVATDNPASAAVLRRIGFRESGAGKQMFLARGGAEPVQLFEAQAADLRSDHLPADLRSDHLPADLRSDHLPADLRSDAASPVAAGKPVVLVAACALIDSDGRILLAQRPEGRAMAGLWEFPGGKVEPGEIPEQALIRELREELGIEVSQACLAPFSFASHGYEDFHLLMPLFLCRRWTNIPHGKEGQALVWVRPERLADYPMPQADRPLVPMLRDYL